MGSLEGLWVLRGHKRLAKGQPEHERQKVDIPFVVRRNKRLHEVSALSKDGTVVHQGSCRKNLQTISLGAQFHKALFEKSDRWEKCLKKVSVESGPFWVKCHGRSEAILDPAQTSFKKFRKFNPNDEIFRTEEILQGEQEGPGQSCNRGAESIEPVSTPAKKKTSIKSRKRSADTLLRDAVPDTGCATDDAGKAAKSTKKLKTLRTDLESAREELKQLLDGVEAAQSLQSQQEQWLRRLKKSRAKRVRLKSSLRELKSKLKTSKAEEAAIRSHLGL